MPTIDWAFLCDYAFVDASGKSSIIGVFENINALALPTTHSQMYVALGMKFSPGDDFEVGSKITSPTGKEISQVNAQRITIPANANGAAKGVVAFGYYGTQFSETGEHHIEIFLNGNSVYFIPVTIALLNHKT
jgi:uncharacterized protein DUF6941